MEIEDQAALLSSDDEASETDPFRHQIKMSPLRWLRTYFLTPILVPLRLTLFIPIVFLMWVMSSILLFGLSEDEILNQPLTGWRKTNKFKKVASFLGRLCFQLTGFMIETKGQLASKEEAPILVVGPHSTFFDGFVVFCCDLPYIVSRNENRKIPLVGKCLEYAQSLFVCREDPQSRQKTVKQIVERAQDGTAWPQLLIFPEGSTSNRKALMSFKPGAFVPGKPVQPVLIRYTYQLIFKTLNNFILNDIFRYPNEVDTVTWTWNQQHGSKSVLWLTLTQPFTRASLEFLPVYQPSPEEIADPKLFGSNVREVMAKALQVPTSDLTFEEVKQKYGKKYKSKKRD